MQASSPLIVKFDGKAGVAHFCQRIPERLNIIVGVLDFRARYPLSAGEIVHILGIAILSQTPVGLYLFAVALQVVRAKIEERKFLRTVPEYAAYREATGFLWPKFRKTR